MSNNMTEVALLLYYQYFSSFAVGQSLFVYVSLREESQPLARRCSFPLSSRVKALRPSLGEASTI